MRRNIDKIEIQEPPIEELKKQHSCLKRTCLSSCGCLFIFLVVILLILKFTSGPQTKELKTPPENWPEDISIYDQDNISKITFISGKERGRATEYIAYGPKLILSPVFLVLEKRFPVREKPEGGRLETNENYWEGFVRLMKEPIADHRDKVQIEWEALPAEPRFIYNYYKDELQMESFEINQSQNDEAIRQFAFFRDQTEGVLYITDDAERAGTDFVSLTVNIGPEN